MSELTQEQRKNLAELKSKISNTPKMSDCEFQGHRPVEYNVIIAPSRNVEQKSSGGIILTTNTAENMDDSAQIGRLVKVSKLSFSYSDKWSLEDYPKEGDLITYARFAGSIQIGLDGNLYRVCKDQDVMTIYDPALVEKLMGDE